MHKFTSLVSFLGVFLVGFVCVGCKSTKRASANFYDLATRKVKVESLEVEVRDFQGRPDAFVNIKGRMSSNSAHLNDVQQYRDGNVLYLEVTEATPLGSIPTSSDPPFQKRVPLEVLGLLPGQTYLVKANKVETEFTMP